MAFRPNDMQAAQFLHTFHIFEISEKVLYFCIVKTIVGWVHILQCLTAFFSGHIERVVITCLAQNAVHGSDDLFSQFAAKFDIHTAPCHIGSNGHGAKRASIGNDLRFFSVLARI